MFTPPIYNKGFDVKLQPLSSIIICIFYEFQAGSICPRMAQAPKAGQREPKGTPKGTAGALRMPKGSPRAPQRVKRSSKGSHECLSPELGGWAKSQSGKP